MTYSSACEDKRWHGTRAAAADLSRALTLIASLCWGDDWHETQRAYPQLPPPPAMAILVHSSVLGREARRALCLVSGSMQDAVVAKNIYGWVVHCRRYSPYEDY